MHRHANPQPVHGSEILRDESFVREQRGSSSRGGIGEGDAKRVAHGLEDKARMFGHRAAHDLVVARDRLLHWEAVSLPALRASFYIAEEERDDPGGERWLRRHEVGTFKRHDPAFRAFAR